MTRVIQILAITIMVICVAIPLVAYFIVASGYGAPPEFEYHDTYIIFDSIWTSIIIATFIAASCLLVFSKPLARLFNSD